MRWARKLGLRLRSLFRSRRVDQELTEELQYHLERLIADHIAGGASPTDARYAALREMGAIEGRKEECRDARGLSLIEAAGRDLRDAGRQLRKYPLFTAAAVLTIAVGIGPNATMATIIGSVFRPLPVPDGGQLAVLVTTTSGSSRIWQRLAYPDLQDCRASEVPFSDLAAWGLNPVGLTVDGRTDLVMATAVSGNYFSTLRLDPAAGRLILPSDGELGGTQPIAVLSQSYWSRRFGRSPSVVGRDVRIDGRPFTIVGVAPENFHGTFALLSSEIFVPLELFQSRERLSNRDALAVRVVGRVKPGVTLDQVRASLDTVAKRLEREYPATNAGRRIQAYWERLARPEPQNASQAPVLAALFLLLVGAILLIACANVLGLFLAKGLGRAREMAIRRALGASRSDLVRLCAVEAFVIALLGTSGGALAGIALARTLASVAASPGFPLFLDVQLDWTIVSYLGLLMMVSALLIGLVPALRASRVDPRNDLAEGKTSTEGRQRQLIRTSLAAAQIAGSVVLLVVCGLFIRSVQNLQSADLGFDEKRVLLASLEPGAVGYDADRARAFYQSLDTAIEALPEAESAAASAFVVRHEQFDAVHRRGRPATALEHHRGARRPALRHGRLLPDDWDPAAAGADLLHARHERLAEGGGRERGAGGAFVARRESSRAALPLELRARRCARGRWRRTRCSLPPRRDRGSGDAALLRLPRSVRCAPSHVACAISNTDGRNARIQRARDDPSSRFCGSRFRRPHARAADQRQRRWIRRDQGRGPDYRRSRPPGARPGARGHVWRALVHSTGADPRNRHPDGVRAHARPCLPNAAS